MHFAQLVKVNIRALDHFDLSDFHVSDGVDRGNFLGNFLFNDLTCEEVKNLGSIRFGNFFSNNVVDAFSDDFLL